MADKRLGVAIPEELHRRLKATAAAKGETLQTVVVEAMERWLEGEER